MKQFARITCLALAGLACAGLLLPASAKPVDKSKDKGPKVYEVPADKDGLKIEGTLTDKDDKDKVLKNCFCKVYLVKMSKDKKYTIRMNAANMNEMDTVLHVEDSEGKQLAINDDAPGEMTLNSRIDFAAPKDDTYKVVATTLVPATGNYTVLVKQD